MIEDLQLTPDQLVRIHGVLSYLDAEGQIRQVKLPIWIEHQNTATNHRFLTGACANDYLSRPEHWPDEAISRYVLEEMQYPLEDPTKISVQFGLEDALPNLWYGLDEQLPLINAAHPQGFEEFRIAGDPVTLGNEPAWLVPLSLRWVDPEFPDLDTLVSWREYMYWQYWRLMPGLADGNSWGAKRALPDWFWNGPYGHGLSAPRHQPRH